MCGLRPIFIFSASYLIFAPVGLYLSGQGGDNGGGETYIEPYRSIEISAVESGSISEILVKEGQAVSKGQELIKLDVEVVQKRLDVARAQAQNKGRIVAAQAEYDQQADRYSKLEALKKRGTSNDAELAREFAILKSYEGNLLAAQEDVKIFELQADQIEAELGRRILKSPIDGRVVKITKDIAETVSPGRLRASEDGSQGDDYLVRVVQLDKLKATAFLPFRAVAGMKEGDVLTVEVTRLNEKINVPGKVEHISPLIDPATSTVEVRIEIDNSADQLTSGSPARVLLPELRVNEPGSLPNQTGGSGD